MKNYRLMIFEQIVKVQVHTDEITNNLVGQKLGFGGGVIHKNIKSHIMWSQSTELHREHDELRSKSCIYTGQASQKESPSHTTYLRSQRSMLELFLNVHEQFGQLRLRS